MIDSYCNGNEAEISKVKTKTAEEFWNWIELKVKGIRKQNEQIRQQQAKSKTRGQH